MHSGWRSHFGVLSAVYFCSMRWNETQNGMDFRSVILIEMKFQTDMRFPCEQNLPKVKCLSADSLDIAFNAHVRLKLIAYINFISVILTEIKFHFEWKKPVKPIWVHFVSHVNVLYDKLDTLYGRNETITSKSKIQFLTGL